MEIGEKIKKLRAEKGMSQQDLAKLLGCTAQNIYKYENGVVTNLPLSRLQQLSDIFDVSIQYLTGETDEPLPAGVHRVTEEEFREYEKAIQRIGMGSFLAKEISYGPDIDKIVTICRELEPEQVKAVRSVLEKLTGK